MKPIRVAGTDPGTSSLDVIVLEDGNVIDQIRFSAPDIQDDATLPVRWLAERGPFELVAGPAGYGLPLVRAAACTDEQLALMALVRPDERGQAKGIAGFSSLLRAFRASSLPVVFLPGVIHLPTVPAYRKINRIDLGTADKLSVAALTLWQRCSQRAEDCSAYSGCVVELGSAFTACVVLSDGRIVDGVGGTGGPFGWGSGGAWDGETAYLLGPLQKRDLFTGGVLSVPDAMAGQSLFRESLVKTVAGCRTVTPFDEIVLSGRLLETEAAFVAALETDLRQFGAVVRLQPLPGAWVKHAAQGAALLADGLCGGRAQPVVQRLRLTEAAGTVLDWICHPRAQGCFV